MLKRVPLRAQFAPGTSCHAPAPSIAIRYLLSRDGRLAISDGSHSLMALQSPVSLGHVLPTSANRVECPTFLRRPTPHMADGIILLLSSSALRAA
jgi:hypothetical protein